MAKNRVAPDRPFKKRDPFFQKNKTEFKAKNKFNKFNKRKEQNQDTLRPSVSGSNDFFVKPNTNNQVGKIAKVGGDKSEKKPFDKKTWRLQKYSKKYKLEQWEDKRKKAILRGYYRNLKEDEPKLDVKKIYEQDKSDEEESINEENENNLNTNVVEERVPHIEKDETETAKSKKSKAFRKAHLEFQRIKEEKQKKKEENLKKKTEKEEALKEYKKKKTEKFKKLNKKTKKGQPIMKDRIEMLLERIQKSV